jgi:hypothetical protein
MQLRDAPRDHLFGLRFKMKISSLSLQQTFMWKGYILS